MVKVNGEQVEFPMRVGKAGSTYILRPQESDSQVGSYHTSSFVPPQQIVPGVDTQDVSGSLPSLSRRFEAEMGTSGTEEGTATDSDGEERPNWEWGWGEMPSRAGTAPGGRSLTTTLLNNTEKEHRGTRFKYQSSLKDSGSQKHEQEQDVRTTPLSQKEETQTHTSLSSSSGQISHSNKDRDRDRDRDLPISANSKLLVHRSSSLSLSLDVQASGGGSREERRRHQQGGESTLSPRGTSISAKSLGSPRSDSSKFGSMWESVAVLGRRRPPGLVMSSSSASEVTLNSGEEEEDHSSNDEASDLDSEGDPSSSRMRAQKEVEEELEVDEPFEMDPIEGAVEVSVSKDTSPSAVVDPTLLGEVQAPKPSAALAADSGTWSQDTVLHHRLELSLCKNQFRGIDDPEEQRRIFDEHLVGFEQFVSKPDCVMNPNMMFRMNNEILPWYLAAPSIVAVLAYSNPLPGETVSRLRGKFERVDDRQDKEKDKQQKKDEKEKEKEKEKSRSSWTGWLPWKTSEVSGTAKVPPHSPSAPTSPLHKPQGAARTGAGERGGERHSHAHLHPSLDGAGGAGSNGSTRRTNSGNNQAKELVHSDGEEGRQPKTGGSSRLLRKGNHSSWMPEGGGGATDGDEALLDGFDAGEAAPWSISHGNGGEDHDHDHDHQGEHRHFSTAALIPTSEELALLSLREGHNTISFTVNSRLQGRTTVSSTIYLWNWDTRLVVSDIDGTITKSDVLGHMMPLLGRQWEHSGVASLMSSLADNGYQIIYLSSRTIGQATQTRKYIDGVKQDQLKLPRGPIMVNPDGLLRGITLEVVKRRPQEFKISCLHSVASLFPPGIHPFYAGFGNRLTDAISYESVGIVPGRVFLINPRGEIHIQNVSSSKRSYEHLNEMVDAIFPPVNVATEQHLESYNDFNYWRMAPSLP